MALEQNPTFPSPSLMIDSKLSNRSPTSFDSHITSRGRVWLTNLERVIRYNIPSILR
ncbi:hypothetical protein Hanom_Chr04g00373161 [Helianthus anomalus]